jgi:GDP-L-fucose synthase
MISKSDRIFVAGHRGLVGSALVRTLTAKGYEHLILKSHDELDLMNQAAVEAFFQVEKPDAVILAAAKVGGIGANSAYPVEFIADNLVIQTNVIRSAYAAGTMKMLFLGSSCIYPKMAPQPISEEALLTGPLEETNLPYAVAKIAGLTMCDAYNKEYGTKYVAVMPTNLYGPGDNFDLEKSHVIPGIMRRMHEAKIAGASSVTLWGTGKALREFLYVDDLAHACVFLLERGFSGLINIGSGEDQTIADLATKIAKAVGYEGEILFDATKPDGTPRKLLNVSKVKALGWSPTVALDEGLKRAYEWFLANSSKKA